jgi:helix-turn-helix protein
MSQSYEAIRQKAGWNVEDWAFAVGISRAQVYNYFRDGRVPSVKLGKSRLITIQPADFLASLPRAS